MASRLPVLPVLPVFLSFLVVLLLGVPPSAAYEVVLADGQLLVADSVQFAGDNCVLSFGDRTHTLAASQIDYYETFRRNAQAGAGNVVVFKTGAFFRFESLEMERSRVTLGLGAQGSVTVPEQAIDFEQSVQEAATIQLPRGEARLDIARTSGGLGSAVGGSSFTPAQQAARNRSQRLATAGGSRVGGLDAASARRAAALRGKAASRDDRGSGPSESEEIPKANDSGQDPGQDPGQELDDDSPPLEDDGVSRRDGIADADELRRRADEEGEPTGSVSVIVSSTDSVEVAGVQFRLRYPSTCTPVGSAPIGAFANAVLAQPNGSVGGRPLFAMAIIFSADSTTSLPGEIARIDFVWRGQEPSPGDFMVVSATASGLTDTAVRGFRAEANLLQ